LIESIDNGKSYGDATEDIKEVIRAIRYYAGFSDKVFGQTLQTHNNNTIHTRRVPYGIVGGIAPWNFPLLMVTWKLFPAIAAGNAVVIKPSEETPLTALKLATLFDKLGFPEGVVNILPGYGHTAGARIANHPKINKVAFTGSTAVGRTILKASAESNIKGVHLELGGKSPIVVFADADIENAYGHVIGAAFANASQNCCCGSRVFVEESIYESFTKELAKRVGELKVGRADEDGTFLGPLINKKQYERVLEYMRIGKEDEKLNLLVGGKKLDKYSKGFFVEPTIFSHVPDTSKLAREEIFGPVLCVMTPFKTVEEAVQRANDTPYGLASGVFSSDTTKIEYFVRKIQAGTVWVNYTNVTDYNVSFGGMKESGFGRDNGQDGLLEFTTTKAVYQQFNLDKYN